MGFNRRRARTGVAQARAATAWFPIASAFGMVLWASAGRPAIAGQGTGSEARTRTGATAASATAPQAGRPTATKGRPAARVHPSKVVLPSDDWTFRPTVMVRRGTSQGSGTIIASIERETLVLTAAHVVQERGPIAVELHRYNFGLERSRPAPGAWPRPSAHSWRPPTPLPTWRSCASKRSPRYRTWPGWPPATRSRLPIRS